MNRELPVVAAEPVPRVASPSHPPSWRRLVAAELHRLLAPRGTRIGAVLVPVTVVLFGLSKLLLHDADTSQAWLEAQARFRRFQSDAAEFGLPTNEAVGPRTFFEDPRYLMDPLSFADLRTLIGALAAAAVVFGIFSGGRDWSSRVMLTLATVEPRRARLFGTRALLVGGVAAGATAVAGALLVPLLLLAAVSCGSTGGLDGSYWAALTSQYLRGIVLVALLALLGYALAMLVRGTSPALAIAFLYLASADRIFGGRGPRLAEYDMDGLVFAVLNEKPVVPLAESDCFAGPGCEAAHVDLTTADGFVGVLLYLGPVLLLALWRSTRTDIT
ncbi:hypothetical protein AB0A69_28075 [Streptomyces sp. NPDC045431]|uniref:hypothetical protein n=1 Tax=Streptomyces sp. NPDC045431 TaxID=3155613 RepID=UPI0033C53869